MPGQSTPENPKINLETIDDQDEGWFIDCRFCFSDKDVKLLIGERSSILICGSCRAELLTTLGEEHST